MKMYFPVSISVSVLLLTTLVSGLNIMATNRTSIRLTTRNVITIRGEINDEMASNFVYELNRKDTKKGLYVFIDTNGGSVDAGSRIVNEIQTYNLDCVAQKAISMGFIILQSCNRRYITPQGSLMQHQISYRIGDEKAKVESYVEYIKQMGDYYNKLQSDKIGITTGEMTAKTYNDWWLFGHNAVTSGCADEIASLECSSNLTNQTYTSDKGTYTYTYSKCPLVTEPIRKKKNKDTPVMEDFFAFL